MQDQRRRGDACECVAHVGLGQYPGDGAGHARRGSAVTGEVPPDAERVIAGDTRREDLQGVESLLDRIRLHRNRRELVGEVRVGAGRIVGRSQYARCAVDDHETAYSVGVVGGENESRSSR